jgi:hypothetical protein
MGNVQSAASALEVFRHPVLSKSGATVAGQQVKETS